MLEVAVSQESVQQDTDNQEPRSHEADTQESISGVDGETSGAADVQGGEGEEFSDKNQSSGESEQGMEDQEVDQREDQQEAISGELKPPS